MIQKKRTHGDFQEFLLENLQDSEEVAAYLQAALADEDERVFSLALRDILKARGETIAGLVEKAQKMGIRSITKEIQDLSNGKRTMF
jgi:DNA-binding phage protein